MRQAVPAAFGAEEGTWTLMNLHSLEPESSASADSATSALKNTLNFYTAKEAVAHLHTSQAVCRNSQQRYINTIILKSQLHYTIIVL